MGRIKTKAIKGAAKAFVEKAPDMFKENFEDNKKILGKDMPSKKNRNMIAGYITRLKKQNRNILPEND